MYRLNVRPIACGDSGEEIGIFKSKSHAVAAMMLDSSVLPYRAIIDSIQEDLAPVSAEGLTVAKLRAALNIRGLSTEGKKPELVARLQEARTASAAASTPAIRAKVEIFAALVETKTMSRALIQWIIYNASDALLNTIIDALQDVDVERPYWLEPLVVKGTADVFKMHGYRRESFI